MAPDDEAESSAAAQPDGPADPKAAFKAALEAKKGRAGGYAPGGRNSSGPQGSGSSAKSGGKREFRRKSG